jgi:hypothetical protein
MQVWRALVGEELVDTINFVHLVMHHGYIIPDQWYFDDR